MSELLSHLLFLSTRVAYMSSFTLVLETSSLHSRVLIVSQSCHIKGSKSVYWQNVNEFIWCRTHLPSPFIPSMIFLVSEALLQKTSAYGVSLLVVIQLLLFSSQKGWGWSSCWETWFALFFTHYSSFLSLRGSLSAEVRGCTLGREVISYSFCFWTSAEGALMPPPCHSVRWPVLYLCHVFALKLWRDWKRDCKGMRCSLGQHELAIWGRPGNP